VVNSSGPHQADQRDRGSQGNVVDRYVETRQIAPTILKFLGLL
jgi:hypothetical protein